MIDKHKRQTTATYWRAVGVYETRDETETALSALKNSGFDMNWVSVIVRDEEQQPQHDHPREQVETETVGNKSDDGAAAGAAAGGALGTLTGLLVGLGTLAIPGIGPILLAGAEATALATTLAGAAIGAVAGGLVGALIGWGIPEKEARRYSDRVSRGDYLVIVTGRPEAIRKAESILRHHNIQDFGIYEVPEAETAQIQERYQERDVDRTRTAKTKAVKETIIAEPPADDTGDIRAESKKEVYKAPTGRTSSVRAESGETSHMATGRTTSTNPEDYDDRRGSEDGERIVEHHDPEVVIVDRRDRR